MLNKMILPVLTALVLVLGVSGPALADDDEAELNDEQEIAAVLNAKTSLGKAIVVAEGETGATAVDAGLADVAGTLVYDIEVAKGEDRKRVLIDLDTGAVILVSAVSDKNRDGDDDGDDD